ncbi:MAG: HAMP domain-containing protein [Planctomycetaceae bacterium]|nr:HAMP domain-containing protein [Planctomycetaceae bacterium]
MVRNRLFGQVFLANLAITVILALTIGAFAAYQSRQWYLQQKSSELEAAARLCAARIERHRSGSGDEWARAAQAICSALRDQKGMRFTLILATGQVLADSDEDPRFMDNHTDRAEFQQALAEGLGGATRLSTTLRRDLMYRAVPLGAEDCPMAVARAALPLDTLAETFRELYREIAGLALLAVVISAAASWYVVRRTIRPLETLRIGADRYAKGELQHRLPLSGAEEIRMLARSMNTMAEQLNQRIQTIVRQENEHDAVLSSMEEGVLALDVTGKIISLNETCARILGLNAAQVRGRLAHEVIRKADLLQFIEQALSGAGPVERTMETRGSESRALHARGTALYDAQHVKIGVLIVLRDVTRLRHLENVRRDFVANVSHELRTPITSIKGFVEALLHENLQDREQSLRFLGIVLKQVNRLDAIIEDLMLLSRIEGGSGEQRIPLEPISLGGVLQAAVEMCERIAADNKQITLQLDCPDDLMIRANAPLIEQAVVNLIDNAIKYSPEMAVVRIAATVAGEQVVIRVQDTGCGIAPVHLPRLFERFYRVDKARSRELGGTGLGLAVVKHIVSAHRGEVRVESTVGRGSTFAIWLPGLPPDSSI